MAKKKAENAPVVEETVKVSAKDRMAQRAKKAEAKPVAKKKVKTVIKVDGMVAVAVDKMCAFSRVADVAESHAKAMEGIVRPVMTEQLLREWAKAGARSSSPEFLTSNNSSFTFITADRSQTFRVPPKSDNKPKTFREFADEQDIPREVVDKLYANELVEKEIQVIASPDHLEEKHPDLAEKLREVILGADWSDEEFELIVQNVMEVKFKPGFLDRAPGLCKAMTDEESYQRLSKVLTTTKLMSTVIKNRNSSDVLYDEAVAVVQSKKKAGEKGDAEFITADKSFKIIVKDSDLTIISGSGEEIGTKKCNDNSHAHNVAAKLLRDKEYLDEVVAELKE